MLQIRVEIPFCFYHKYQLDNLKTFLKNEEMNAVLDEKALSFKIKLSSRKHTTSLWGSASSDLQDERVDYRGKITLYGELSGTVDLKNNLVIYNECEGKDLSSLNYEDYSRLDDYFLIDLMNSIRGFIISCILVEPTVGFELRVFKIYYNNKLYRREFAIGTECISGLMSNNLYSKINLSLKDVLKWMYENTSYFNSERVSPVYFSALTYALNREANESLIYAVIGLENLLLEKGERGIKYALKNKLSSLFPNISQEEVKQFYEIRSDFVHGKLPIDDFGNYNFLNDVEYHELPATLACVLLIDSIRLLIKNNATRIDFSTSINYEFK